MGARVAFLEGARDASAPAALAGQRPLVVPSDAVQGSGDTGFVFVVADDSVERRAVRLGAESAAGRLVLSGLTAGTRVAVGDTAALADDVRVRIVE
jgi:hypothetical protein